MPHPPRLLIVDDEVITSIYLRQVLEDAGFPGCRLLGTGKQAIQIVQQESFDMIILDISLPQGMDGVETARQMRAAGIAAPIIFITGFSRAECSERIQEFAGAVCLEKPVNARQLVRVVQETLSRGSS